MGTSTHGQPERTDDFDCTVCLKLLYEPVTTPCGHSFCRSCLFQSMDHGWYLTAVGFIFLGNPYILFPVDTCPIC